MTCVCSHFYKGIGLLINNVGIANEIPKDFMEITEQEIDDMIQCNIFSTGRLYRHCVFLSQI